MGDSTNTTPLRVTILGAGLAGLATAISLSLSHSQSSNAQSNNPPQQITLLDALPSAQTPGAGLQLTPNATRILSSWSLLSKVEAICAEPRCLVVHRYADGKVLACDERFAERCRERYGADAPFIDVHRGDLQRLLLERAAELGVHVRWGCKAVYLEVDAPLSSGGIGMKGVLESGEKFEADVVVGADGIWSRCREALLGRADPPLPTGDLAYRIVLTLDDLAGDEELQDLVSNPECHFWIGPHSHAVGYSVRSGTMYNLVLLCPDDLPSSVARQKGEVSEMRKLFEGWDPILTRLLERVTKVDKWKLMHRPEMERWVSEKGSLVVIGDCHPMLPYLAQGANSAMEDGAVLGWCLSRVREKGHIEKAVRLFEKVRKERREKVARETFLQREQFHMPDGPEQEQRDRIFKSQLGNEEIDDSIRFPSRWQVEVHGYSRYVG